MTEVLGHHRYAAAGCDVGALVTGQLGHKYADELYGIHIGSGQKLTLFNGADSPAGMLAWILQRWASWSAGDDVEVVFPRDDLLTHATIYWATSSIGTSVRTYANNNRYPWTPAHDRWPVVEAPTGITFVAHENPPGVTTDQRVEHFLGSDRADWYNIINTTAHDRGGHFIPWEIPEEWVADLQRTFRGRRGSRKAW